MLPVFYGTIGPDGELRLDHPIKYRRHLEHLAGKRVALYVRQPSDLRSLSQNRYYHGIVVRLLADQFALSDRETHELVKKEFGVKSTAVLGSAEFELLMERVRAWALTDHGVTIPLPNEVI